MIREYLGSGGEIACLVPYCAFSAATLIAVGCNEVFMHPLATLGPVDPQITAATKGGAMQHFAYEDATAYVKFLREEAGLSEQTEKKDLLTPLVSQIAPSVIGGAKRASMQSRTMAERPLKLHPGKEDRQKAERIAEELSKNYFAHGHAVARGDAREFGLQVCDRDTKLEELIWKVYRDYESDMRMSEPFEAAPHSSNRRPSSTFPPMRLKRSPSRSGGRLCSNLSVKDRVSTSAIRSPSSKVLAWPILTSSTGRSWELGYLIYPSRQSRSGPLRVGKAPFDGGRAMSYVSNMELLKVSGDCSLTSNGCTALSPAVITVEPHDQDLVPDNGPFMKILTGSLRMKTVIISPTTQPPLPR
jgi:hypothetical protein